MLLGLAACGSTGNIPDSEDSTSAAVTEEATEDETTEEAVDNVSDDSSENTGDETDEENVTVTFNTVSDLKGTGPATLEDTFSGDGGSGQALADGDKIIDVNFDDNDISKFFTYTNGGACEIKADDGQLAVNITKTGDKDYSNQVYYDGFALNQNCVYTYSFDISSDVNRSVEYRLQINGGDYHAYMSDHVDVTSEVTHVSVDFEMTEESDPAPRLVFNMGIMEGMTDPGEHNIFIDNIVLEVKDSSKAATVAALPNYVNVGVNQLGYKPEDEKIVSVKSDDDKEEEFIICDAASNETVYVGTLSEPIFDYGSQYLIKQADFSDYNVPGSYYIYTAEGASYTFEIKDDPYTDIYNDAILMLYKQRCGTPTDADIAGDFAHEACHTGEALVWDDQSKSFDVTGGWHDAGDYGRYVVAGAVAVADLLEAYEDFEVTSDEVGIPESGNGIPDILDEAKYELDWMLKMQDPESGGVYHKVTCAAFPETVGPEEETDQLYLSPISQAATGDFAAIMAKASMVYKDIDPDFSVTALAAAQKAWDYLVADEKDKGFRNPKGIDTGDYSDDHLTDERYWASVELYLAGDESMEEYINKYASDEKLKLGLGWADVGSYADYDLAKCTTGEIADIGITHLTELADEMLAQADNGGYFMGFGSGFEWGSNMRIGNNGQLLYMASKVTGDDSYSSLAGMQLDYLLGNNPLGYCFVTGYGTLSPQNPHHRPSQVAGKAMTGMLVGGANRSLNDPYAVAVLSEESAAMCYVDNVQSYSTNEITIYWNSPLIYLLSAEMK